MKIILIALISIITFFSSSQNLIPNGDFESNSLCPSVLGQLSVASPWYQSNLGTSDYFNECSILPNNISVPSNYYGFQIAHSGYGYCGFSPISDNVVYQEYITTKLISPLIQNEEYCIRFWYSNADSLCLFINKLDILVSQEPIFINDFSISASPQYTHYELSMDSQNWNLIEGTFIAEGGEEYLSIGIFDTTNLDTIKLCNDPWASSCVYLYIDDVELVRCGNSIQIPNVFTPNNDYDNDDWIVESNDILNVEIFNRWGNKIFEGNGNTVSWNGNNCIEGIYFYKVTLSSEIKNGFIQLVR